MPVESWIDPEETEALAAEAVAQIDTVLGQIGCARFEDLSADILRSRH